MSGSNGLKQGVILKIDRQARLARLADEEGRCHDFVFGQAIKLEESCKLRLAEVVKFRVENDRVTHVRRTELRH